MDVSLRKLIEVYDDFSWPPYPKSLMFSNYISRSISFDWKEKRIYYSQTNGKSIRIPVLHTTHKSVVLEEGDQFNAIVMHPHTREGYKSPKRIFQFRDGNILIGYIHYEAPKSGREILEKEDVREGFVYRFEIVRVGEDNFDCVPLARTFNKDSLEFNLTHCNYEKVGSSKFKAGQPIIHV